MKKFHGDDSGRVYIRHETLTNGKVIAFAIAVTDLSSMQFGNSYFDFDKESDEIIKRYQTPHIHHAFEYVPNSGFDEVETGKQNWFVFKRS